MSWKEFVLQLAHDYRTVVLAFVTGWHLKQPKWIQIFKKEKEEG